MKYQLVIFDWQGTLTDASRQFVEQFYYVAQCIGMPQIDKKILNGIAGHDLSLLIPRIFPGSDPHKQAVMMEQLQHYQMQHRHDVYLHQGVSALLNALRDANIFIAIATAASANTIQQELSFTGMDSCFDAVKTPDFSLTKPAPDMLNELMDEFGCDKQHTLMIGDSPCDFGAAQNAGVDFIGIHLWDKALEQTLKTSDISYVENIAQLREVLAI